MVKFSFLNISEQQIKDLEKQIDDLYAGLYDYISTNINTIEYDVVFGVLVRYFFSRHETNKRALLKQFLQNSIEECEQINNEQVNVIYKTLCQYNVAGRLILRNDSDQYKQFNQLFLEMIYNVGDKNQIQNQANQYLTYEEKQYPKPQIDLQQFINMMFNKISTSYIKSKVFDLKKRKENIKPQLIDYTKLFFKHSRRYKDELIKHNANIRLIDKFYNKYVNIKQKSVKASLVVAIYEQYIKGKQYIPNVYIIYRFIQYLLSINLDEFHRVFKDIEGNGSYSYVIDLLQRQTIHSDEDLRMKSQIIKYQDYATIKLNFADNFKLDNLSDETIIGLFNQFGTCLCDIQGPNLLIIHDIANGTIIKSLIKNDEQQPTYNVQSIRGLLKSCQNNNQYNIIIINSQIFPELADIKLRYLSCNKIGDPCSLNLKHPDDLCSFFTQRTSITNIAQCTKLQLLYSVGNTYKQKEVQNLKRIKVLYTSSDTYDNNSLATDILNKNPIEFIYSKGGNNIKPVTSNFISNGQSRLRMTYHE